MHEAHVAKYVSRANRYPAMALLFPVGLLLNGCGLIGEADEYVIQVDSVAVAPPQTPNAAVRTTYHGYIGANGCANLRRVERQAMPGDTLQLRFIGRGEGGSCTQMPLPLMYVDSIPNLPARTVHLRVLQRSGVPLRYDVVLPLTARR